VVSHNALRTRPEQAIPAPSLRQDSFSTTHVFAYENVILFFKDGRRRYVGFFGEVFTITPEPWLLATSTMRHYEKGFRAIFVINPHKICCIWNLRKIQLFFFLSKIWQFSVIFN